MTPEELKQRVAQINGFHAIDLGQGVVIPRIAHTPAKLQPLGLPGGLSGKPVLDVGSLGWILSFHLRQRSLPILGPGLDKASYPANDGNRSYAHARSGC